MSSSTLSYVVWTLILAYALALWGVSYLRPGTVAHPSQFVGRLARHPVVRVVLVLGFLWLGWHTFAR